mmetsp:Transcript_78206/g.210500  ORF Transcript_78206/g.210500 Transcript_78206/m.210500 type:complete len:101 (-) Transcript_78206:390-692(-)
MDGSFRPLLGSFAMLVFQTARPCSAFSFKPYTVLSMRKHLRGVMSAAANCSPTNHKIRFFLVRHGQVNLSTPEFTFPKYCFYGGHDVPLSEHGKAEAKVP